MVNELLVNLVNSVLGSGKRTSRGNIAYHCPLCNHPKPKLEIQLLENAEGKHRWACWACGVKGQTVRSLFKRIAVSPEYMSELSKHVKSTFTEPNQTYTPALELPKEYKSFIDNNTRVARIAYRYLKSRGLTPQDILKFNIGYCETGLYANMIVIPSYDSNGKLNYFTARSFDPEPYVKYRNPTVSRDIVAFESLINWNLPIILCEGPFDAIAIKRNVIPLLGKNIQPQLMKKLVESRVQKVYIALDNDAIKKAIEFCEELLNIGKEVYLVELSGKDPSELGFETFTKLIQTTQPLTQYKLMEQKLNLI
jgi:DNA primase